MSWPNIDIPEVHEAVNNVIKSGKLNYWTGNEAKLFEKEFAEYINCMYAIALSNGTVALECCLKSLNLPNNSEVIVSCRSFVASASSIVNCGFIPIFADVDLNSQNVTATTIEEKITSKTKAIIIVHLAGYPCEMDPIITLCRKYSLYLIEDCAQAHGAKYKNQCVGTFGDVNAWSFCQDKIMTTGGEGGMITTNNETLYRRIWELKDHGKNYDMIKNINNDTNKYTYRWLHTTFGSNYRMTELQACIGRVCLKYLDKWVSIRRNNAKTFDDIFKNNNIIRTINVPEHIYHSYYKYYMFINQEELPKNLNRDKLLEEFNKNNIKCFYGSCPEIYLEECFKSLNNYERLPNAKLLGETSIMFNVDPCINENQIKEYANKIINIIGNIRIHENYKQVSPPSI